MLPFKHACNSIKLVKAFDEFKNIRFVVILVFCGFSTKISLKIFLV